MINNIFRDTGIIRFQPAVDSDNDALRSERLGKLGDEFGALQGRGIHRNLVRAVIQDGPRVINRPNATGDTERDVDPPRDLVHPPLVDNAPVAASGDVVEDKLIDTFIRIALRQFENVAHVTVVTELDALHDTAVTHVQAGDDALCQHVPAPFASAARRSSAPS